MRVGVCWFRRLAIAVLAFGVIIFPRREFGYSVQTHEQLVDLAWKDTIVPLLLARYPGLTEAQLREAHSYAYGGSAIQDLGYYPFGREFFSDLTHYVRAGDFVRLLLTDAKTPDELAFAIGALSHYVGDVYGHSLATNPSVAQDFPRLRARFGPSVTYDENPHAHVRTEFAFDINEISKHRFAPSAYLSHVGLMVAVPLLDRVFFEVYGLHLNDVLGGRRGRTTLFGYRFAVRRFLPRIAYAENVLHRKRMPPDVRDTDSAPLIKALAQSEFENGWNAYRKKPGIGTYSLAGLIFILPKVGILSELAIKVPSVSSEQEYVRSLNKSIAGMSKVLGDLKTGDTGTVRADLDNRDLDTGEKTVPGGYRLTDVTYAILLERVTAKQKYRLPSGLKRNIEDYYADPDAPIATKRDPAAWARVQAALVKLETLPQVQEP